MADIIEFPKMKRMGTPPTSEDDLENQITDFRFGLSEQVSEVIWQTVLTELIRSGCNFSEDPDEFFPALVLILETIKSLHLQTQGIEHPLQQFARDAINIEDFQVDIIDKTLDNEEDVD